MSHHGEEHEEHEIQESREDLAMLHVSELQDRLKALGAKFAGLKKAALVNLLYSRLNAGTQKEVDAESDSQDEPAETQLLDELQQRCNLSKAGAEEFMAAGYESVSDIQMLQDHPNLGEAIAFLTKPRDQAAIKIFLTKLTSASAQRAHKPDSPAVIRPVHKLKEDLRSAINRGRESIVRLSSDEDDDTAVKRRRRSVSGESHGSIAGEATKIPKEARLLPRPHTVVTALNGPKDRRKTVASDLNGNEFMQGSLQILRDMTRSVEGRHAKVLQEYADYLSFLAYRRCHYSDASMLQFGDEFRSLAECNFSLNDIAERSVVADKHFHSGLRRANFYIGNTSNKQPFRPPGASAQSATAPGQH